MSRPWVLVFVFLLFSSVGVATYFTTRRGAEVGEQLATLDAEALTGARFVSDPLRDPRSYDVAIDDPGDRAAMVAALHSLEPSSVTIKSLTILDETKLELDLGDGSPLLLTIMRTQQTGDVGVVSVDRLRGSGELPAGNYESRELLAWVEAMAAKPGFEAIVAP